MSIPKIPKNQLTEQINGLREEKDHFFKTDLDSPLPPEERPTFKGLKYYPPDERYRVSTRLERLDKPGPVSIMTSAGSRQSYLEYGHLRFEINGMRFELKAYKSTEDPFARSLFVPFSDETSGSETYRSGRYLDLEESGADTCELDFNLAYNPYCAYNPNYICPIPPKENRPQVKILAGEKNYK